MNTISAAVLALPSQGEAARATVEGVERQSRRPEEIVLVTSPGEVTSALLSAGGRGRAWVWLLDAAVVPEPDALEAMLDAATAVSPMPALLTSLVLTPSGSLDPVSRAVAEVHNGEKVIAALEQHTVPVRVARRGSLLIRGDIIPQLDADELVFGDLVWTARLLGRELGLLVPSSHAVRLANGRRATVSAGTALRVLRELPPRERAWFATYFAEQAASSIRCRLGHSAGRRPG